MAKINILIEAGASDFNWILVPKKDNPDFEKKLIVFLKKWKDLILLFEGRFLYKKQGPKGTKYHFFKKETEELDISSSDYSNSASLDNVPNFKRAFMKFLAIGEEEFQDYSFGLTPFDSEFYIDFFKLTSPFGEISFIGNVTVDSEDGYWDSTYTIIENGIDIDASYLD